MDERDKLITKLKFLINLNSIKQKEFQEKYNLGPEVGCLTKEACIMTSLLPKMMFLKITLDDLI